MYFKRIELHGFKSFVEPVVVEFDKGITCVVGPNGSGKSNISDAIRWVLGEQSSKMLRCDKMEDVIFAGTTSRKSRGMAEVTLVIDNSTGILPIDFSEVAITRRLFRSGESEYAINNSTCRLKDITELLLDTGIGVEGYSLIGQGHIGDIISNKSDSIKEIFEESAGIVSYRKKKEDAEKKLASSSVNMERVADIIGEIEGRIDNLKEDSAKASEYLELRDRYKELEINITLKSIETIEQKAQEYKQDVAQLQGQLDSSVTEKADIYKELEALRLRSENLDELSNETRETLMTSIEEINALVNRSEVGSERLAAIEKDNQRLIAEIAALENKLEREKNNSKAQFDSKEVTDLRLSQLTAEMETKVSAFQLGSGDLAAQTTEIDGLKNQLFDYHNDMSSKKAQASSLSGLRETLETRRIQVLSEKDSGESGNQTTLNALQEAKESLVKLEAERDNLKEQVTACRKRLSDGQLTERETSKRLEELNITKSQLSTRKKTIEEMESNYEGYNGAVKHIMRSGISGIHGVVAELITVPTGFEIAMETALGGSLQHIVCDADATAKKAILELKNSRAGRLTFLPVAAIKAAQGPKEQMLEREPGYKGIAANCIQYDPAYANVMQYLLGRVVVMDNMDNAIALSKKIDTNLRFVTLEGEIINANGAITGGKYKNNSANLLERRAEISKLEENLKQAVTDAENAAGKLLALQQAMTKDRVLLEELEEEFRAKELGVFAAENEIKIMDTAMGDFKNNTHKWERELENIDREMGGAEQSVIKLNAQVEEILLAISKTETTIEAIGASLEQDKEMLSQSSEEITKARIAVNACENEKTKIDEIVERINDAIFEIQEEKGFKEQELDRLKTERDDILKNFNGNEDLVREKELAKEDMQEKLKQMTTERSEVGGQLNRLYAVRDRLDETLNALQGQKYELEIKMAKQEAQLENFKEKLWEEFELSYLHAMDFKKEEFSMNAAIRENRDIKNRLKELGEVNVGAIKEYKVVSERYTFLSTQRTDIEASISQLRKIIEDMDKIIRNRFKDSFDKIVQNFEEVFVEFFGGGKATITLSDEINPLDAEIQITAQPPGKQLKSINLLSGGEKTMTAIALMFAVLKTKPTPCCILDEVEAALDDTNIDIFAKYLKKFDNIQFTLITHQKATMEHADAMYGVTMPERGVSKIYSLKLGDDLFNQSILA
jgi:chromosome segregation protein